MAIIYLADAVRQDPSIAQVSWNEVQAAVQETLPGSDFHDRYRELAHVGLAGAIVGDQMTAGSMNPLESAIQDGRDPKTLIENMPFFASNKHLYPEVWATQPQDERLLGGPVPEFLGRYGAFALAKINALTGTIGKSSFNHVRLNLGPGRSGFAGGIRDYHALLSISGLWEVHDHVVAGLFADDVAARTGKGPEDWAVEDKAEELSRVFTILKRQFPRHNQLPLTKRLPLITVLSAADKIRAERNKSAEPR